MSVKSYYLLTKPGIIYGNAAAAIAGFFLAEQGHFQLGLFVAMLAGLSLVIGSACVFNNYLDRGLDAAMRRTSNRALVKGTVSPRAALTFATILGLLGLALLALHTNPLTASIALVGFVVYVVLYGISKRQSVHGTLVGSIAGAVPPVVGYCAVTNHFDLAAFFLFLVLVIWQMPHFYAIALFRADDYASAGLPVLPVVKSVHTTKVQIASYIVTFIAAGSLLTLYGYTGYVYLATVLVLGVYWLYVAVQGFHTKNDLVWAKKLFRFSLIVLVVLCIVISLNAFLP